MTTTTDDASLPAADDDGPPKGRTAPVPGRADDPFDRDDLPAPPGATRALLFSLLAPMRGRVAVSALLLLVQQVAMQAGPLLVAYAIDSGVPAFRDHDYGPLMAVAIGYAVCSVGAGVLQYAFIRAAARINQDVLLDLRGRIFRHAQALSVDFHERYTSGRIDLALHDGCGVVAGAAERGAPGTDRRGPVVRLDRVGAALAGPGDRRDRHALVRTAVSDGPDVPAAGVRRVHGAVDGDRGGDREVRGDDERHPSGPGVPPRAEQRHRLHHAEHPPRAGERRRDPGDGPLCHRFTADREHGGGRDGAVGRLPGGGRDAGARGAGGGGAVSAAGCTTRSTGWGCSSTPTSRRPLR